MKTYIVRVPYQNDIGSIAPFTVSETFYESKESQAIWQINSMRRHDGLKDRKSLPKGTRFEPKGA